MFRSVIGGVIGGAVGALIWIAVGYYLNAEVGYVALGVGFLSGLGVAVTTDEESVLTGLIAVLCAVMAIAVAKYFVISMQVDKMIADIPGGGGVNITADDMVMGLASDVIDEYEEAGKPVKWKPGMTYEDATTQADYPKDIWSEATKRWDAKTQDEQNAAIAEDKAQTEEIMGMFIDTMKTEAFKQGFGGWDLLWFGLAALTAFRVAAGGDD